MIERYGGLAESVKELDVFSGNGGGDCGYPFETGKSYLISAGMEDGEMVTTSCSGTKPIVEADVQLGLLRRIRDGRKAPTVIGQVPKAERNFNGSMDGATIGRPGGTAEEWIEGVLGAGGPVWRLCVLRCAGGDV